MKTPYANKKIAVLAANSAHGETGGAERFYQGLVQALSSKGCQADLVSVQADESNFDAILRNYAAVAALDLSSYDLVISTKAPTFVAHHDNHILYLVHTTRVFYDMFEVAFPWADDALRQQRRTIQALDTTAIAKIARRFSIGHEVSERLQKWNGLDSEVLHPPLALDGFHCGKDGSYFFLPGRLHAWKRVDLVIRAIKGSTLPLELLIAGDGENEADLRKLADGDTRIRFLGRISDEELIHLYANALAVPFVPIREDYGYVTLEAFASGKPVITCRDSGEPLQFVVDGKTGCVCDPQPESVRTAMEFLFNNRSLAGELGMRGRQSIEHITWSNVADRLLLDGFAREPVPKPAAAVNARKTQVAILDMQPIDPAVGGGRLRLLGLYHALGESIEARYVGSYDWPGEKYRRHHLSATLEEIDVPLSEAHHAAAARLAGDVGGKTVIDLAFPRQCHLSPAYLAEAREAIEWADIVVFSHPWVFPLVSSELRASQLVVYDSQNVEGFLQAQRLGDSNAVEVQLLREVVEAEYAVGRRADLILACSSEDLNLFVRVYEWPADKIRIIPNAVMASRIMPPSTADRAQARKEVGLAVDDVAAIFVGSAYQPNVEAADFIVHDLAHRLPNCHFVIAGGVGSTVDKTLAANITVTGPLDDLQKLKWLHACDLAVNPMFSGSGTNIKMFDFMAAGLPVVSTRVGARGISTAGRQPITIANDDADAFAGCVQMLIGDREELRRRGTDARACVDDDYSWEKISPQLGRLLTGWKHTLGQPRPRFTVILTTDRHDQLNSLMGCLQDQVERDFEVVLVDQSPRPWPGRNNNPGFPLNYVHMTVKGAVRAKNLGALHAQGAILAFVDHDCRPVPDWLRAAYPYFTAANVQALEWLAGSDSREPPSFMQCLEVKFEEARFINSNLMIRAEAFHNAGGFSFPSPRGRKDVRRLAHLSTVGQACGVGEYTARLLVALAATRVQNYLVTCSTKRVRPSVSALPVPGEIGWEYDDEAWRDSRIDATVAPRLAEWGADHVLIQYHPAFFSGPMLTGFAESCLALGMHVAVVIHNFSLADFSSFNRLCEMGCLLIAHSSREVAEARAKGIAVTHLPFFVPSYGPRALKSIAGRNLQEAPPVIASTGFIRPHKGLRQLIEALVIVRQVYPRAQLKLICALHPAPDSLEEYRMCIDTIEKHGLEGAVEFESGFLPIDEVHRRLAATDLAVLPYGPSTEGGSAAAATVIAAGVPLLISRSEVFESVLSAADVLPDTEPHTIAGHICRVLGDAAAYDDLAARSVRHGEANSVSAVGRRLLQVLATQAREPGSSTP